MTVIIKLDHPEIPELRDQGFTDAGIFNHILGVMPSPREGGTSLSVAEGARSLQIEAMYNLEMAVTEDMPKSESEDHIWAAIECVQNIFGKVDVPECLGSNVVAGDFGGSNG